jgi:hypothetical protein
MGGGCLHPCPDVDVAAGDFAGAEEDVAAVAAAAVDPHRVLAAVGLRGIKADLAALAAVGGVGWPCCLVPSILESLGDLGERAGHERESDESDLAKHGCGADVGRARFNGQERDKTKRGRERSGRHRGIYLLAQNPGRNIDSRCRCLDDCMLVLGPHSSERQAPGLCAVPRRIRGRAIF